MKINRNVQSFFLTNEDAEAILLMLFRPLREKPFRWRALIDFIFTIHGVLIDCVQTAKVGGGYCPCGKLSCNGINQGLEGLEVTVVCADGPCELPQPLDTIRFGTVARKKIQLRFSRCSASYGWNALA